MLHCFADTELEARRQTKRTITTDNHRVATVHRQTRPNRLVARVVLEALTVPELVRMPEGVLLKVGLVGDHIVVNDNELRVAEREGIQLTGGVARVERHFVVCKNKHIIVLEANLYTPRVVGRIRR